MTLTQKRLDVYVQVNLNTLTAGTENGKTKTCDKSFILAPNILGLITIVSMR